MQKPLLALCVMLLVQSCEGSLVGNMVAALRPNLPYDGGRFTLQFPSGWTVTPKPIQNLKELLVTAESYDKRYAFMVMETPSDTGIPLTKDSADMGLKLILTALVSGVPGTNFEMSEGVQQGIIGRSNGFASKFSFQRQSGGRVHGSAGLVHYRPSLYTFVCLDRNGVDAVPSFNEITKSLNLK